MKQEIFHLISRNIVGQPTIFGPHLLTWLPILPGVWLLVDMRPAQ